MIEKIGFLEETFAMVAEHAGDGINKRLNPFKREKSGNSKQAKHKEKPEKIQFSYGRLQAAIAFLSIQQKLLGRDFRFKDLLENSIILADNFNRSQKKSNEEGIDESKLLTGRQTAAFDDLIETLTDINSVLPSISIKDIRLKDIREELTVLERYHRGGEARSVEKKQTKKSGVTWYLGEILDLFDGGLPYAIQKLPNDLENAENLVAQLKTTDSIYLHQVSNLLQQQLDKYKAILQGNANEGEIEKVTTGVLPKKTTLSQFNHLDKISSFPSYFAYMKGKDSVFRGTIKQLDAMCLFTNIIQNEGLTPVGFNDTGEVRLLNGYSIFKKKDEQVKNSASFSAENERIELLTGPNGSGKTFYKKGVIGSILMGLATGYVPAENATMPVFDTVVYLDRVVQKQDVELSAFSQELEYWKELLPLLYTKKTVFAAVDEAFSSTSPLYQAAFTYAVVAEFLQSNHFLMLSTHNHDVVERLKNAQTGLIHPYHFQFSVENGKVVYHYTISEGHETSHAVEVARTMGLPEEIISS